MKKLIEFSAVLAIVFFAVSACSKNPVGPAMPSMSISAASTSTTAATASVTSGNGSGETSVSTAQTGSVTARPGDTGVTSVYASTGVNSAVAGSSSASAGGVAASNYPTIRLTNHYTSSGGLSGYFDFSAGKEVLFSGISSGDLGFRGTSNTNITFGSGMDFGGPGGLKLLGNTDISTVTSVTMDGFLSGLGNGVDTPESYFLGKCIAVSSQEGKIYIIQITGFDPKPSFPTWIEFKWKAL